MKPVNVICLVIAFSVPLLMGQSGCEDNAQVSKSGAKQANPLTVPLNSKGNTCEQQNILDRNMVTTDPTKVMWIHLIALDGKIIRRMPVRNKITSSGKRLEPKHAAAGLGYPESGFKQRPNSSLEWNTN